MADGQMQLTYQEFIDDMVELARRSVSTIRITSHGHSERTNEEASPLEPDEVLRKDFCESLSDAQRSTLVAMLQDERMSAVHDVLAYLEWAVTTGRMQITASGGSFADVIGESMHGDFIARWDV